MRHVFAASAVIALSIALAVETPDAQAKKDPEAVANAKMLKQQHFGIGQFGEAAGSCYRGS